MKESLARDSSTSHATHATHLGEATPLRPIHRLPLAGVGRVVLRGTKDADPLVSLEAEVAGLLALVAHTFGREGGGGGCESVWNACRREGGEEVGRKRTHIALPVKGYSWDMVGETVLRWVGGGGDG